MCINIFLKAPQMEKKKKEKKSSSGGFDAQQGLWVSGVEPYGE